jgi:hypothetical protein
MKSKIAAALVVALTIGTVAVSGTSQAQAHHWHGGHGWGWGGVGLGLAFGAVAASNYYAADCFLSPRYDRYGNVIRYVKVCNY